MTGYTRIYYDIDTGEVLQKISKNGDFLDKTINQEIDTFKELSERNRDTFDVLELAYDSFARDFVESSSYRVNPQTKELEFSYPNLIEPEAPPVYIKPLTEQVAELEAQNMELMLAVAELSNANETDKIETQLAIAELASMVAGGGR